MALYADAAQALEVAAKRGEGCLAYDRDGKTRHYPLIRTEVIGGPVDRLIDNLDAEHHIRVVVAAVLRGHLLEDRDVLVHVRTQVRRV